MEGAEFTESIINGVERPVKAAELFAFTLRVRAGNTDVLTDAEENVRQKLRAEEIGRAVQQECPRPISYAVFCLKKKMRCSGRRPQAIQPQTTAACGGDRIPEAATGRFLPRS